MDSPLPFPGDLSSVSRRGPHVTFCVVMVGTLGNPRLAKPVAEITLYGCTDPENAHSLLLARLGRSVFEVECDSTSSGAIVTLQDEWETIGTVECSHISCLRRTLSEAEWRSLVSDVASHAQSSYQEAQRLSTVLDTIRGVLDRRMDKARRLAREAAAHPRRAASAEAELRTLTTIKQSLVDAAERHG